MQKQNTDILSQSDIDKITSVLKNDGIIAFPTDTVWGLGADPTNEIAVQKILSEHSDGSFSSMKNIYDALKSLGYEGNFGELEKFIPAFEHMNAVDKENRELKNKNKELSEKNELLTISNSNLQQENDNLHEENSSLKDENTNLKEKMQEIVQNVKKYKDFVLETVRNMPVIGKFMANKIQKEDRALNSGMDR